jgi:hypothetical protein
MRVGKRLGAVEVLTVMVFVAGCSPLRKCKLDSDCSSGEYCHNEYHFCVISEVDAGAVDGGEEGAVDGGDEGAADGGSQSGLDDGGAVVGDGGSAADGGGVVDPPHVAIVVPPEDADCSGVRCIGAIVNLDAGSSYTFSGTLDVPGGLAPTGGALAWIDDSAGVVAGPWPIGVSGGAWSVPWSTLPGDNGKAYEFVVEVVDTSGQKARATRKVWLDRVAPTGSPMVHGQRLISRTRTLVVFSEPMEKERVLAATTFNGVGPGVSYGTSDGRAFGFTSAGDLVPYQAYDMVVALGASDMAGNRLLTSAAQRFLTEMAPVPAMKVIGPGENSRVALDADGKPHVLYMDDLRLRLGYWDGRMFQDVAVLPQQKAGVASDVRIHGSIGSDLDLRSVVSILFDSGGEGVRFAQSDELLVWSGRSGAGLDVIPTKGYDLSGRAPSFAMEAVAPCDGCALEARANVLYSFWSGTGLARPIESGWSGTTVLNEGAHSLGAAVWTNAMLYFVTGGGAAAAVAAAPSGTSFEYAIGAQQLFRPDLSGSIGSAFVFELHSKEPNNSIEAGIHCSPTPGDASSWRHAWVRLAVYESGDLSVALSPKTLAVGLAQSDGLRFLTFPNDACALAPPPEATLWTSPIAGAAYPSLAFGPDGVLWKSYSVGGNVILVH